MFLRGNPDESLLSFAAITDEPPAEVASAGHDRCIVPVKARTLTRGSIRRATRRRCIASSTIASGRTTSTDWQREGLGGQPREIENALREARSAVVS